MILVMLGLSIIIIIIIMFKDVRIIDILTSLGEYHKPLQHSELCESP